MEIIRAKNAGFCFGVAYLNDVSVVCHFSKIGFCVSGGERLHFLPNQHLFFTCYIEFALCCLFSDAHVFMLFSVFCGFGILPNK